MDPALQQRYFDLRKQLSSLNYSTNFGLDAVDVIQQLFGDLISTTESYTQLQEKEYELAQDLSLAQAQLFPLKKENAKISRENQQLHMDTVKLREELTDHQDTLVARIKELEDQLKESTFLCGCKDESLRKGEQQRIRLREAYEQLASSSLLSGGVRVKRSVKMSQSLPASGQQLAPRTALAELGFGESKSQSPEQKKDKDKEKKGNEKGSRMSLKKNQKQGQQHEEKEKEKEGLQQKQLNEQRHEQQQGGEGQVLAALQRQVEVLQGELKASAEQQSKLADQLRRREDEWQRAARQLGASDIDTGSSDASNKSKMQNMMAADVSNQRIIEQLNGQVDFLNEHLALRETQLSECAKELQSVRELQAEHDYRGVQLEQAREHTNMLTGQLRVLEARVQELQRATDPDSQSPFQSQTDTPTGRETHSVHSAHSSSSSSSGSSSSSDHVLQALSNDKRDLTAGLEQMSSTLQSLEAGDTLLQGRLARTEASRAALREQLSAAEAALEAMQQKSREAQEVLRQAEADKEELLERLQKTQAALEREAEARDASQGQVLQLQSRLAIADAAQARLEAALSELKESSSEQRKALSSTSLARDDKDFQVKRLTQERDSALQVVARTQKELTLTQDKMLALDASQMQLTGVQEDLEKQVAILRDRVQSAEQEANAKGKEYQDLLERFQRVTQKSREQEVAIAQLNEQINDLGGSRESAQQVEAELESLQHEHAALLGSSDAMSRQVSGLKGQLEGVLEEKGELLARLEEETSACSSLQGKLDSSLQETRRLENLIAQRAQAGSSVEGGGGGTSVGEKLNAATLLNSELQAEVRLVTRRLFDAESQLHQSEEGRADLQRDYARSSAALEKAEQKLEAMSEKLEGVRSLLRQREEEVEELTSRGERLHRHELDGRRDLREVVEEKEAALQAVKDLKLLLKNMESEERDAGARVRRMEGRVVELQQEVEEVVAERDEARRGIKQQQALVEELREAIRSLDADRDDLQNQLDELGDEEARKQHLMAGVHQQAEDLTNLLQQRDKLIESLRRDKEHTREQLASIDDRFRAMVEESAELRRRLALQQHEAGAASEDLLLMTRENQSLTTELASVSHERDRLKQRVVGYTEQVNSLEHSVRALEVERGDLLETYRTCLQERRKLEVDLGVMSESKARLSHTIHEIRGDLADASAELATRRNNESRQLSERSALLLQVEALNDQLVSCSRKVEDRERDLNRLAREKDGLQQTVLTLQQRSHTLVSRAASAGDASKVLQARVTALEREREALRGLLDGERKRAGDMAQLIAASRSRDALLPEPPSAHSSSSNSSGSVERGDSSRRDVSSLSHDEK